jgi:hypothetical protein
MTTDDDGLDPAWDGAGDALEDDRLAEDGSTEDVTNLFMKGRKRVNERREETTYGAVWALPHFLELELFDTSLVGGDGSTFNADMIFENGIGGINGDLVIGLERLP